MMAKVARYHCKSSLSTIRTIRTVPLQDLICVRAFASTSTTRTNNPLSIKRENALSEARKELLAETSNATLYPRLEHPRHVMSISAIREVYGSTENGEGLKMEWVTVRGRIKTIREASSKLIFYDLVQDGEKLQVVANRRNVNTTDEEFKNARLRIRVGDIVSFTGYVGRTERGELSMFITQPIQLLAPCLHVPPPEIQDIEKRFQHRHVDLIIRPQASQLLRLRSDIIRYIRDKFHDNGFTEVQTPVIADIAGGAIAKPFITEATVYRDRKLALRIAPELWLKRLVVGGMERVFEIGPQFRNEGIDPTHNPEFTTCEFYQAYANLDDLMKFTEDLISGLAKRVAELKKKTYTTLSPLDQKISFEAPFKVIDFIPALEEAIGRPLPDLDYPEEAAQSLLYLFSELNIPRPTFPTLPRLLDKLSSIYLEPECESPTFIVHHPECLSPLAKTVIHNNRRVSTRIELFIAGKELVNAYEEENSPTDQKRKFQDQAKWKNSEENAFVGDEGKEREERLADEAFVAALEWGLPPTAGWGLGIDRLCMLFGGTERIADVLTFGGLRGVIGQGGVNTTQVSTSAATVTPTDPATSATRKEPVGPTAEESMQKTVGQESY